MSKITIVYWSGTGNTEKMAQAIADGVQAGGAEAELKTVSEISAEELAKESVFALGCPAMGSEELEDSEMEPFMCDLEKLINGKKIVLFGSYGWGDGSWMQDWEARVKDAGAQVVTGAGMIANDAPDDEAVQACMQVGKELAGLTG